MSIWIRAVCRHHGPPFTREELRDGIGRRLSLLIALYCPDDEEPADNALERLELESLEPDVWALRDREDDTRFIRIERWHGTAATVEARELRERVPPSVSGATMVNALLDAVTDVTAFELRNRDADGMRWPIAIAAAAWLAARDEGLVHAEGQGWLQPTANEIRPVR